MAWFDVIFIFVPLFSLMIGVFRWKNIKRYRYLYLFVGYGWLTQIAIFVLRKLRFGNTMFIGHIYVLGAFVLLCLFYGVVLKGYVKRFWFKSLIVLYFELCVLQLLLFQNINDYPSVQFAVLAIVMVLFAIIYFQKTMVEARVHSLVKEPMIWFNAAVLFFYTGSLFHYILYNLMLDYSHQVLVQLGDIMVGFYAIFYLLIGVGFWQSKK